MELSNLKPARGSRKARIRVGRGESSGCGKTSGHGGKGQKGRAGASIRPGFEGGQMPLYRRLPKLGFVSRKKVQGVNDFALVRLSSLESFTAGSVVDAAALVSKGLVAKGRPVKVLGTGTLSKKLSVKVEAVSSSARSKIEAVGGSVELTRGSASEQAA